MNKSWINWLFSYHVQLLFHILDLLVQAQVYNIFHHRYTSQFLSLQCPLCIYCSVQQFNFKREFHVILYSITHQHEHRASLIHVVDIIAPEPLGEQAAGGCGIPLMSRCVPGQTGCLLVLPGSTWWLHRGSCCHELCGATDGLSSSGGDQSTGTTVH